jgi:hypothetical protein
MRLQVCLVGPDDLGQLVGQGGCLLRPADAVGDQRDGDLLGEVGLIGWVPPEVPLFRPCEGQAPELARESAEASGLFLADDAVSRGFLREETVQRGLQPAGPGRVTTGRSGKVAVECVQELREGESLLFPVVPVFFEDLLQALGQAAPRRPPRFSPRSRRCAWPNAAP